MTDNPLGDVPTVTDAAPDAGENVTDDLSVSQELPDAANQELASDATSTPEESQTQETKPDAESPDDPAESKDVKAVRDWGRSLEKDIREKYKPLAAGLEQASNDLFGTATPEDLQATIQTVQALAPSIKVLTDPNATQADVVAALQKMLPAEHVEAIAWATLNDPASQEFIFSDPDVIKTIEDRLFHGRTVAEIEDALANAPETEADPEREAWRKEQSDFRTERQQDKLRNEQAAARTRTQEFATRFYETPAERVIAEDFKLVAPEGANEADKKMFEFAAKAAKFTAQALFIEQNGPAAEQIQNLYANGKGSRASADAIKSEIGLANRYEATLIKTAEFFANLLKSRSVAAVNGQQDRINGVRPDVTGSVEGTNGNQKDAPYDFDQDPVGAMRRFSRDVNPGFHN